MKQYKVFMDITVTKTFSISAESEEQAREEALRMCRERSDYYARDNDGVVDVSVSECEEDTDPEDGGMAAGLDYVRDQMDESRLIITRERVSQNLRDGYHVWAGLVCTELNIRDWLEEYGADNDLPEGWWEEYGDIDDWLLKL